MGIAKVIGHPRCCGEHLAIYYRPAAAALNRICSFARSVSALYAVLLALLHAQVAFAQVLQTPDTEEQRRRSQAEAQERQQRQQAPNVQLQSVFATGDDFSVTLPAEVLCFTVRDIALDVPVYLPPYVRDAGAHTLPLDPFFFAQEYLRRYAGSCIGREGLGLIVKRLTNQILARGYTTTRVGIPEQDMSKGVLTVTLVPGVIHAIRFSDPAIHGSWKSAFPARPGELVNLRDLEQGLEQMKRVASQDVDMQIVPGAQPGESDVVIDVKRDKPWKFIVSLDDSGAKGTGKYQAGLTLGVDNLFGINDLFSAGLNTDADRKGAQRGTSGRSLTYSAPYGYWTVGIAASSYNYHQEIAGRNQTFVSSGNADNVELKIQRLFQRDQVQKNTLQFRVGKRWSHAFIDGTEIEVQRRNTTFAELAWVHKHYFGNAQLDLTVADRRGVDWFNGQGDLPGREPDAPTFIYNLQTVDATFVFPFKVADRPLTYIGNVRAQTTKSPLFVSDQFSIGNRYTVRGFDGDMALASERGVFMRNELVIPIPNSPHSAYAGIDFGRVYGPSVQNLLGDKLAGAALGLRGTFQKLTYDVFVGWALYKPDGFRTETPAAGFNLTYQY